MAVGYYTNAGKNKKRYETTCQQRFFITVIADIDFISIRNKFHYCCLIPFLLYSIQLIIKEKNIIKKYKK